MNNLAKISIPTEAIGSIPRPEELLTAKRAHRHGRITCERLDNYFNRAVQTTVEQLEATGSPVVSDGEQMKPSFLSYPIYPLLNESYSLSQDCFALKFTDGKQRVLPRLIKAPFRYAVYADTYIDAARQFTSLPIKQAVITPSAMSLVYPRATIRGYSHDQFLKDLINESEKDIRLCLDRGVHCVQMDFTEGRFCMKIDPTGQLLQNLVQLNNEVLERFKFSEQHRLGVHFCPGGDQDCGHTYGVDYLQILPTLFQLHVGNFYLQLAGEPNREKVLTCIRDNIQPWHRVFVGVINPSVPQVETAAEVCERVLEAAKFIPIEQLGTTDDCGFAPFDDDQSTSRQIAFDKIRARIEGTRMAEEQLNAKRQKKN